jgi:hypothetical protein
VKDEYTVADGKAYVGHDCTLDGMRARVTGGKEDFAVVRADNGVGFQWSWEAVSRIMAKGGNFKS